MELSDIFRIANLVVAVFIILGGIGQFFPDILVQNIIIAVYLFIFGLGTGLLEFQIPPPVAKYASFMFSFIGRGVFYIFVGMISCGGERWWRWIAGVVVAAVGVAYVALEFIPSIEPPANMREAEQGWGAEQI
ncbi:MAG: hypothetical protein Q9162_001125 [Coniocarpon cinnabarinum]